MPSSFLAPDTAERRLIKVKSDERDRIKKSSAKLAASNRKKARDNYTSGAGMEKHVVTIRSHSSVGIPLSRLVARNHVELDARLVDRVDEYLMFPPYYGRSDREHNERVKYLCGEGRRVWSKDNSMWGTTSVVSLQNLVNYGKWVPFAIEAEAMPYLIATVGKRAEKERAAEMQRDTEQTKHIEQTRCVQEHAEERRAARRIAAIGDSMVAPTLDEVESCAAIGLLATTVLESRFFTELGPRVGMSNEGRLLRWVGFEKAGVCYGLKRAICEDPVLLQLHVDRHVETVVRNFNERRA